MLAPNQLQACQCKVSELSLVTPQSPQHDRDEGSSLASDESKTRLTLPSYIVLSVLEMLEFGGIDAESQKKGINLIFSVNAFLPLDADDYKQKFVTTGTVNVNFGC